MGIFDVAFGVILGMAIWTAGNNPGNFKIPSGKWWRSDYDVTDNIADNKRSGLVVYIDHETGCQYVGTSLGGLSSRLDANGKPICNKPTKQEPL